MSRLIESEKVILLLRSVEKRFGHKPQSPREFKRLSQIIHNLTGESISDSTLKRLWGYDRNHGSPYRYTLDILARYSGYGSAQDFFDSIGQGNFMPSPNNKPGVAKKSYAVNRRGKHNTSPIPCDNHSSDVNNARTLTVSMALGSQDLQKGQQLCLYLSSTSYIRLRYLGHSCFEVIGICDNTQDLEPYDSPE